MTVTASWPIYKYQPITTTSLSNLAQRKLWASSPSAFNDPFECRLQRTVSPRGISSVRLKNPHLAHVTDAELVELATEHFESQFARWGMVCYAQHPNNILMWSHYADQHRGMCLEFTDEKPLAEHGIYRVEYSDTYPELTFEDEQIWHVGGLARILFTKHSGWSYEHELRQIHTEGNRLLPYPGALSRVVFGLRTTSRDQDLVRRVLGEDATVRIAQVELEGERYAFRIVDR